jgi:succinate dehydrogenase / fumarate reductase iron-sulfur subunit
MSEQKKELTITVARQKPGEEETRLESYRIPYQKGMSVLDALDLIRKEHDPSLAYHSSCRHGKACRLCAAEINGKAMLMCDVFAEDGMVVKPAANKKAARDLIPE